MAEKSRNMADREQGGYEAGRANCLQQHRRLASLDPNHELLRYGIVSPTDTIFSYNPDVYDDAVRRFSQDGRRPRTTFGGAFMLARHSSALKDAADAIEEARRKEAELAEKINQIF
jgi:hypothetical protein